MARFQVSLLDVEPELGSALSRVEFEEARRRVVLPTVELEPGAWDVRNLGVATGVRGEVLGFAVLSGVIAMDVWLARRTCTRLIAAGEYLLLDGVESDSMPISWGWSVIVPARLALFDERLLVVGQRWPRLLAAVLERGARQTRQGLLQQAISQLPRVEDRLLALFWSIADLQGIVRADGIWVELPATHDTIARMIGARRPTVSLGLSSLADRGLLRGEGSGWVLDPRSLDHFAQPPRNVPTAAGTKARGRPDRARPNHVSPPLVPAPPASVDRGIGSVGRPRVLLVAADPALVDSSTAGCLVIHAGDEGSALSELDRARPHLVVLDVSLLRSPDNGRRLVERLRASTDSGRTRLMLIAPEAGDGSLPPGLAAAAHDYLFTPFAAAELQARLQAQIALAQGSAQAEQALPSGFSESQLQAGEG